MLPSSLFLPGRRRLLLAALAGPHGIALAAAPADATPLHALAERYFDALLDANGLWASQLGIATPEQAAQLPITIAPAWRERMVALNRRTLAQLERIDRRRLDAADGITHDVLRHQLHDALDNARFPDHLLPVDHMPGSTLFMMASAADNALSPFASVTDHERHLQRLRQLPAWCEQAIANLREGVRRRIGPPAAIIERMLPMLRGLANPDPRHNAFAQPVARIPQEAPATEREQLAQTHR